jgi:hypothetical protein
MPDDAFLERYVEAWVGHVDVLGAEGEARLQRLLALMADDVEYVDVPTNRVSFGHEGVRRLTTAVSERFDDISLRALSAQSDGERFAIEYECRIVFDPEHEVVLPGVAVGEIGADGKVVRHRDYYDRSPFPTTEEQA